MHSLVQAIKLKEIPPKLLCLVSLSSNDKNIKISKKRRCRGGRVGDFQVNKIKILIGKAPRLRPGGFLFFRVLLYVRLNNCLYLFLWILDMLFLFLGNCLSAIFHRFFLVWKYRLYRLLLG